MNNSKQRHKHIVKPCKMCGFCPYGFITEKFPKSRRETKMGCEIFGKNCPAFYIAEFIDIEEIQ